MHGVNITASTKITIGKYTRIVHRCQVLDTNYHYVVNLTKRIVPRMSRPIEIGDYCWICNSTTITGGAIIPEKTIVASNSLVNKDFSNVPPTSIIGGIPAKLIGSGFRRIESLNFQRCISDYFRNNPLETVCPVDESIDESSCNADNDN